MATQVGVSRARIQEGVDEDEEVSVSKDQAEFEAGNSPQRKIVGGGKLNSSPKKPCCYFVVGAVIFS
jgi:hypothetical protein